MNIYKNKLLLSVLVLAMVFSGMYYAKPAAGETVKTFSQATEIEEGAQYALVMSSITPTGMSSASYFLKDTPVNGTTTLMGYDVFNTSGANDNASLWEFERVNDGYAIKASSISNVSSAYINLSSSGVFLGAKQELSVSGSNGSFTIASGSYRLRFTNSGNGGSTPGFASGTNTNSSTWRLYKAAITDSDPTPTPTAAVVGSGSFVETTIISEGTDYALAMSSIAPSGMANGTYYLKDTPVSGTTTLMGYAAFDASNSKVDETSLWRFERVNSGYAIRSAAITNDAEAYLNISSSSSSASMGPKQELDVALSGGTFTIKNGNYLLRFTNSGNGGSTPGYTSGTNTASSAFRFYKVVVSGPTPTPDPNATATPVVTVAPTPDYGPTQKPTNDRNEYESTYITETDEIPAYTYAFVSDIHVDYGLQNREQQLRQGILTAASRIRAEEDANVIGVLGDVTSNNAGIGWTKANYDRMMTNLTGVLGGATESGRILMVTGNHDFVAGGSSWNSGDYSSVVENSIGALPANDYFDQDNDSDSSVANLTKNNANASMKLAYHYVIDGVDFICINTPYSGGDNHGSYVLTQSTLDWVQDKLEQIGNDKPVVVLTHYPLSDSRNVKKYMAEPYNTRLKQLLLPHKNAILVYGHDHGNVYINEDTYERVTPYSSNGTVLNNRPATNDSFVSSFVGSISYYANDYNTSSSLGADEPWVVQALMVYVYSDRITFQMKNYGSRTGVSRCPAPYTVYKDTGVEPNYMSAGHTARPSATPTAPPTQTPTPTATPTATPTKQPTAPPTAAPTTKPGTVIPSGVEKTFEEISSINENDEYAITMSSITPTGMSSGHYYMKDTAVSGTTTLLDFAAFAQSGEQTCDVPLFKFERMGSGYAIKASQISDASKAYINIDSSSVSMGAKQELSVNYNNGAFTIMNGSNRLRFTNSGGSGSIPGFTGGTKEASSTFRLFKATAVDPNATPKPTAAPTATPTVRPTRTPKPTPVPDPEDEPTVTPEPTVVPGNSDATPGPGVTPPANVDNNNSAAGPTVNPNGQSGSQSTEESAVTLGKVKGIKAKRSGNKAAVSWKKLKGSQKYVVLCATDKKFKKIIKKITVRKNKAVFKKLKKGKIYFFKVQAVNGKKKGKFSAVKKIKV